MEWQSPRSVEADKRNYLRRRFEHYWVGAELGVFRLLEALQSLRDEIDTDVYVDEDDCPTLPFQLSLPEIEDVDGYEQGDD